MVTVYQCVIGMSNCSSFDVGGLLRGDIKFDPKSANES